MNSAPKNNSGADIANSFGQFEQIQWGGVKLTKLFHCTAQLALEHDKLDYRLEP